jgi:pimeloyl-ACP methyl ester carboxylesterase
MFHGYADSADTWRLTLAQLARTGQRAVAVDLPGFGGADDLDSGPILPVPAPGGRVASYLEIAHRMLPELRGALALEEVHTPLLLV